jgi:hypothetical protein
MSPRSTAFSAGTLVVLLAAIVAITPPADAARDREARDYIRLVRGPGGACEGGRRNTEAESTHPSRRIQATFRWSEGSSVKTLAPGDIQTVGFCNYGAVRVAGARFVN